MSTEPMLTAFLDDIAAHPRDPSLWLILADWLDERDDPRVELVRLHWAMLHEKDHPEFDRRQQRVQQLLAGRMRPVVPTCDLAGFAFAWIPPGSFVMGSPDSELGRDRDETQHPVTISRGFWMGTHQITQAQWLHVMGDNPSEFSRHGSCSASVKNVRDADLERFPVENISRDSALVFCQKLTQTLNRDFRLPTEAEWEYACRAGTTTPFHFGKILDGTQANSDGRAPYGTNRKGPYLDRTTVVGSYPPNAWGLYDMHGNVADWCQDAYVAEFENLPEVDPLAVDLNALHYSVRGGNWLSDSLWSRSAERTERPCDRGSWKVGLRLCFSPR